MEFLPHFASPDLQGDLCVLLQITVILLKDEEAYSLFLIIKSSVGGLLVLIVIIVILVKCGFFKRKYRELNLESIRKDQLKSESARTR